MADEYTPEFHPSMPGESARDRPAAIIQPSSYSYHDDLNSPRIQIRGHSAVASCGSPTTLLCSIAGDPAPTVFWLHGGVTCGGEKYCLLNSPPLFCLWIKDTSAEDAGDYTVVAENSQGKSTCTITLSVLSPAPPEEDLSHADVPIMEFPSVYSKLTSSQSRLMEEFFSIEPSWTLSQHAGNLFCNKNKNRYYNVLPYDHSRVVLTLENDVPGSDYINACNMTDDYIASQGPLPNTFTDFWRMLWENNIHTIAMMTKISDEHSIHMKCHRYWPKSGSLKQGNFTISLKGVKISDYYEIRILEVTNGSEEEPREVCHFQFLGWPEYGVPKTATNLLDFRKKVREYHSKVSGPLLVHCSAGVGRTGTFLCIDMLLCKLESDQERNVDIQERKVNIFNLVRKLRHRRERTVETPDQYILIYEALDKVIKSMIS